MVSQEIPSGPGAFLFGMSRMAFFKDVNEKSSGQFKSAVQKNE
jgi:hypothetical protein